MVHLRERLCWYCSARVCCLFNGPRCTCSFILVSTCKFFVHTCKFFVHTCKFYAHTCKFYAHSLSPNLSIHVSSLFIEPFSTDPPDRDGFTPPKISDAVSRVWQYGTCDKRARCCGRGLHPPFYVFEMLASTSGSSIHKGDGGHRGGQTKGWNVPPSPMHQRITRFSSYHTPLRPVPSLPVPFI